METINLLELTIKKENKSGGDTNLLATIYYKDKVFAQIVHAFMHDDFFGNICYFSDICHVFKDAFFITSVTQIKNYGNKPEKERSKYKNEIIELKFSEIKTRVPELNSIITFFNSNK